MTLYLVALEPDKILSKEIKNIKKEVRPLVGDQLYLKDEPHFTIYFGDFRNITTWIKDFEKVIKKIREDIGKIQIKILDWIIFKEDIITKKHTLACDIAKKDIVPLKKIQIEVVGFLKLYRNQRSIKRYKKVYKNLGKIERQNLEKYGFPFVGRLWKPHLTIASFEKKLFSNVWVKLKNLCPKGTYKIISVNIYSLKGKNEYMKLLRKYPLNQKLEKDIINGANSVLF